MPLMEKLTALGSVNETYFEDLDLWEAVEEDNEIPLLPNNPTMAQIKNQKGRKTRKSKAKACLFVVVSTTIFTRVMSLKTTKAIFGIFSRKCMLERRIRGMQVLTLIREFELQKMKVWETITEYSDRLLSIVNRVSLLGTEVSDSIILEKILAIVPER